MTLKRRISLLEKARASKNCSAVIEQAEGQSLEDAIRASGIYPIEDEEWSIIVVPVTLTEEQWCEKDGPEDTQYSQETLSELFPYTLGLIAPQTERDRRIGSPNGHFM